MSNPDHSAHGSETCLAIVTLLVVLGLLAACVAMVVEAY